MTFVLSLWALFLGCLSYAQGQTVKVAMVQTRGSPKTVSKQHEVADVAKNLEWLEEKTVEAAAQGAELIVFPEMYLTGYNLTPQKIADFAESRDGPSFQQVSKIAKDNSIAIVYGFPELQEGKIYNAAIFVDDQGATKTVYHKTHLFGTEEREMFSEGSELGPVVEYRGVKFGLLICYDIEFPEPARVLTLKGAEAILVPTANFDPYEFVNRYMVQVRAAENNVYVMYANRIDVDNGFDFNGESLVADPLGERAVYFNRTEERTAIVEFDPAKFRKINADWSYAVDRRPALYNDVCAGPAPDLPGAAFSLRLNPAVLVAQIAALVFWSLL